MGHRGLWGLLAAAIGTPLLIAACSSAPPGPGAPPGSASASSGRGPGAAPPAVPPGGIDQATRFTPLTASTLTTPSPVTGTDGKIHLAYELVLTNASALPVRLDKLDILEANSQQVLLSLAGPALIASSNLVGGPISDEGVDDPTDPGTPIPSSATSVVWLDVATPAPAPTSLTHRVTTVITPPGGPPATMTATVARVAVNPATPAVLGPPLRGGPWYASDGCCADDTHHRRGLAPINGQLLVPQRFAIDWFLLDDQHRTWVGDPSKITSYLSYDKPAIASADGVVVDALDGLPETTALPHPPPIPPIAQTVGNHVTLMVAPGVYLLYAHFKPGSVAVRAGQRVKRGDVLGHIGSSGNSSTPHLHFQVMTTGTFFPTDSPPFAFDCFELDGQITDRIWDDNIGLRPTNVLPYVPAPNPGRHTNQMPLDRNVLRFSC